MHPKRIFELREREQQQEDIAMHSKEGICMHIEEFQHLLALSIQQLKEESVQHLLMSIQLRKRHEI
jgi:hypothetical protein